MTRCTYLKPNGQQCRGHALWGSDPPRCAVHRQDGGPPSPFHHGHQYGRLRIRHGFYTEPLTPPQDIADEAADILLKHERFAALIARQREPTILRLLYYFYTRNLGQLVALLDHYHQTTGRHPDRLLALANQKQTERRAALDQLRHTLASEPASTYPTTPTRAPRYWLVYNYILNHIRQTGVGPTHHQIMRACHLGASGVEYWLAKLEQDGRIIRHPGQARAIHLPPDLAPPPIQPELPF